MLRHGDISGNGSVFWSYDSDRREIWLDPARFFFRKNKTCLTRKRLYAKNLEKNRIKLREYHHANKEMKARSFKNWSCKNKDRIRHNRLKRTYGITGGQYAEMLATQGFACKICGCQETHRTKDGELKELAVDHCHKTNVVRGLLCQNCNVAIGKFKEDIAIIINAIKYLQNSAPAAMGAVQTQGM